MIASIIILIILVLGTGGLIAFNIIKRRFIDIKNLVYFLPALAILLAVYIVGYLHSSEPWDNSSFFACLTAAMDGFKFSIKKALVTEYMEANIIFKIDVYWATVLTGLTVFSSIAGIFKVTVMNFFARKSVTRKENFDIVIGNEEECKEYAKNHKKKCLYWIDPDFKKLTDEDKKGLYLNSIPFYNKPFIAKTLLKFVKKETHIICFQKSGEHFQRIIKIIKELPETDRVFYFHVQGEEDHLSFIDDELASITDKRKDLIALSFDLYELMAKAFNKQYNLAMYLPEEAFDPNCKYCIKEDYPINVVMLGFGKTAYAIFRGLIANNQFVHIDSLKHWLCLSQD